MFRPKITRIEFWLLQQETTPINWNETHLDPGEEHGDSDGRVELCLPVAQEFEVSEFVRLVEKAVQFVRHR